MLHPKMFNTERQLIDLVLVKEENQDQKDSEGIELVLVKEEENQDENYGDDLIIKLEQGSNDHVIMQLEDGNEDLIIKPELPLQLQDDSNMKTEEKVFVQSDAESSAKPAANLPHLLHLVPRNAGCFASSFGCESEPAYCDAVQKGGLPRKHSTLASNKPYLFTCDQCAYRTNRRTAIVSHFLIHDSDPSKLFSCKKCGYSSNFRSNMKRHIRSHKHHVEKLVAGDNTGQLVVYDQSDYHTNLKFYLKKHPPLHPRNAGKQYTCGHCQYKSNNVTNMKVHLTSHDINHPKPYACNRCNYCSNIKSNLTRHVRMQHQDDTKKMFSCTMCQYNTKFKTRLIKHIQSHKSIEAVPFSEDSSQDEQLGKIGIVQDGRNMRQLECDECNYSSDIPFNLWRHLCLRHNKYTDESLVYKRRNNVNGRAIDLLFACNECEYSGSSASNLKKHFRRMHMKSTNQSMDCKIFDKITDAKAGDLPLGCDYCAYSTNRPSNLKRHLCTVHKKYTLEVIQSNISNNVSDDTAIELVFACNKCEYNSKWASNLRRHLSSMH